MEKEIIVQLHADFEKSVYMDQDNGIDFWLARDLQELLGYAKWENFAKVIEKAKMSCKNADFESSDHFLDIRKKVELGLGTVREVDDIARGSFRKTKKETTLKMVEELCHSNDRTN